MPSEERKQAKAVYDMEYMKKNVRQYGIKVNKLLEPDMVEWLNSKQNVNQYVKSLIAADMRHHDRTRSAPDQHPTAPDQHRT